MCWQYADNIQKHMKKTFKSIQRFSLRSVYVVHTTDISQRVHRAFQCVYGGGHHQPQQLPVPPDGAVISGFMMSNAINI